MPPSEHAVLLPAQLIRRAVVARRLRRGLPPLGDDEPPSIDEVYAVWPEAMAPAAAG